MCQGARKSSNFIESVKQKIAFLEFSGFPTIMAIWFAAGFTLPFQGVLVVSKLDTWYKHRCLPYVYLLLKNSRPRNGSDQYFP